MEDLIILGAGGLGQEIAWLVEEINQNEKKWNFLGFLDSHPDVQEKILMGYPVLGPFDLAEKYKNCHFVVAFGDPRLREKTVQLVNKQNLKWANLISPTVRLHSSNKLGKGVVIGRNTDLTIDCELEDHVMLNIHVVLGHKVKIGKFSIISPNVTINGGASIGHACSVGANAFVRDIIVGDYVTIGASSCVVKNVEGDSVVAGVPAKLIRKGAPVHSVTTSQRAKTSQNE
jgi:sugar O-acyltransferase (sialic acid O-acetyltransferase NeuD family)